MNKSDKVRIFWEGRKILQNLDLTFCLRYIYMQSADKSKVDIFQNFVAFSEYMNFIMNRVRYEFFWMSILIFKQLQFEKKLYFHEVFAKRSCYIICNSISVLEVDLLNYQMPTRWHFYCTPCY